MGSTVWSRVEQIPARWALGGLAAWVALPWVGVALAEGAVADGALVLLSTLGVAAGGVGFWHRRRVARLPLELCPTLLRGEVDGGATVYRVRVRLGHGRTMRRARARVRYEAAGESRDLRPVLGTADVLLGPWTIAVVDRDGAVRAPGALVVEVTTEERGRTWAVSARFDVGAARTGRFGPGFAVDRGAVRWRHERWADVVEERGDPR